MALTQECVICKRTKQIKEFATNANITPVGRDYWCNDCKKERVFNKDDLMYYCSENKRIFNIGLFEKALNESTKKVSERSKYEDIDDIDSEVTRLAINYYFSKQNLRQFQNQDINTSIIDTEKMFADDDSIFISSDMYDRWGFGLSKSDYVYLEKVYSSLIGAYQSDTPIQRMIYEDIAKTRLEAEKARRSNNLSLYEKLMKILSSQMNDANLKPVQKTAADTTGLNGWGVWIKKIEEEEPIPEARDEFKDIDGIKKYIQMWFVSHFEKVFGLDNNTPTVET